MALKVDLLRPDDLLNLQIECRNLKLDKNDPANPVLVPEDAAQTAYLIAHFPPQTIAEEAVYEPRKELEENPERLKTEKHPAEQKRREKEKGNSLTQDIETILRVRPARARLGQPTRLVFQLPANSNPRIPYSIEGLLNWTELELSVSPIADIPALPSAEQRTNAPPINPPGELETAIEMPYRLVLSPDRSVVWVNAASPQTHTGRTELWHTRLAYRDKEKIVNLSKSRPAPLRAIWSPDYIAKPSKPKPSWPELGEADKWAGQSVLTAMNRRDRHELVILTSAFRGFVKTQTDWTTYEPKPIEAEQVMLSPLGGWLKSRGSWEPPIEWIINRRGVFDPPPVNPLLIEPAPPNFADAGPVKVNRELLKEDLIALLDPLLRDRPPFFPPIRIGEAVEPLNISEWVHIATQGRDHYVRIVYEGYLYPFGHRAALVKVTERKFNDVNGSPVAYLAQRMFIVVRQPLKDYTKADASQEALPNTGRGMPLKQVRLTTLITPDIGLPARIGGTQYSFWVEVGGNDFKFHAMGQDSENHTIDFTAALIFVPNSDAVLPGIKAIRTEYKNAKAKDGVSNRRICQVPGQPVTYAPANGDASDNTTLTTRSLYFDTDNVVIAKFLPRLDKAAVNLTAVEQLIGTTAETEIKYFANYLNSGFDSGNEVFAELFDKVQSKFSADKAGGISTPNLSISGVTRKLGAIAGDLTKAADNKFEPDDFFKDVGDAATLFGKLKLAKLISAGTFANAPTIQFLPQAAPPAVKLNWKPSIEEEVDAGFFKFVREAGAALEIEGLIEQPTTHGEAVKSKFTGKLTHFHLAFLNVVKLSFDSFSFTSETDKKTDVNVQLKKKDALEFLGDLEFINELKNIIPPGLFGDGPSLEITPEPAIRAGFAIGLPPVAVGVFALKDVSLGAALTLPFINGSPLFDFNISERQHPFNLTVAFFGGGGFFHLQLDTQAIRVVEAAFEFGASASINLGVASGGVHVLAGIYFKLETKEGKDFATLSGYLRMGGELSVLGLISISLEFMLSFTYESKTEKATGIATLTVKVEVLFFSKSIEITVEKKFGGQNGDPIFVDVWDTPRLWNEYANAFA
jgi:hypothetical protein